MCGIAGFWNPSGLDYGAAEILRRMTDAIRHRGPDGEGHWLDADAGIALGHRRLSILDLSSAGAQPMVSPSGRYVITYNGEIYNWRELRRQEEQLGAVWRGHSDTEVFLALCDRVGIVEAVRRSSGMFAMGIWDTRERTLTLVRDRVGEKPLYYGWAGRHLLFGSELKALCANPHFTGRIDQAALGMFFQYAYVPGPFCIYAGIRKLQPGTVVTFSTGDEQWPVPQRFWSWADLMEESQASPSDSVMLASDLDELLQRVVASEMVADVPLGAFLSGGIDSSLIVALMQAQSARRVRTFTIGFREDGFDEAAYAQRVAAHLKSDHTELYLSPRDALDVIPELATVYDEPFADSSQIPTMLVSRLTREHVTVAVSGDGGDEVFTGYNRYIAIPRLMRQRKRIGRYAARMAACLASVPSPQTWDRLLKATGVTSSQGLRGAHIHKVARILGKESLREMYQSAATTCDDTAFLFAQHRGASQVHQSVSVPWSGDPVTAMMVADGLTYLPDDILVKVDRASMASSLEVRAPYLHRDVLTFAAGIPAGNRTTVSGQGKALLRQVLSRYVPPALTERPKSGFAVPLTEWLNGPLRPWVNDLTASSAVQRLGLNRDGILRLVARHRRGRAEVTPLLWSVLTAIAWAEGCGDTNAVQPVLAGRG